ncbi:PREDICTED: orexin receptor type 2-like [Nicrophorus vespilloides]|uniref:Orexin receptor type 2-like n=1 Tax=Nicrophorus vespilloides TaxID=110193 RepID=A0ABM1NBP9_NICVS|nr:PREDICTED: orexin receptor type 2-like [Nicrophorus vespilloides]
MSYELVVLFMLIVSYKAAKIEDDRSECNQFSNYLDRLLCEVRENSQLNKHVVKRDLNATYSINETNIRIIDEEEYLKQIEAFIYPKVWTWVLIGCHGLVFVAGLIGNTLVVAAIRRNRRMRTFTNYLIVNLAVADFLVLILCLPPSVIWDVTLTWFFGTIVCKVVLYLQTVSVTISVLTLTFISVDRWYAICSPLEFKSTTRRARTAILVIWISSLIFDIPELVVYSSRPNANVEIETIYFTDCAPSWSKATETKWAGLKFFLLYAIPLCFMTFTYTKIIMALWQSGHSHQKIKSVDNSRCNFSMASNSSTRAQLRSRKSAAKMLVSVVGMFAICYFPVHLLTILRLTNGLQNSDLNRVLSMLSHWLCYANSAVNPIIYNFMSSKC